MPKLIDRQANAELVHPIVMRILADEGPHAVTYRRIVAETDLTLSAIRNMWQNHEELVQRGAAHARSLLPCRLFLPSLSADLDLVVREGVRRLLPLPVDQRLAHRALASLRWAPAESAGRAVLTEYDEVRRLESWSSPPTLPGCAFRSRGRVGDTRRRTSGRGGGPSPRVEHWSSTGWSADSLICSPDPSRPCRPPTRRRACCESTHPS